MKTIKMNLPILFLILSVSQIESQQWKENEITYKKTYKSVQDRHNQNTEQKIELFWEEVNKFSDLAADENSRREVDSGSIEQNDDFNSLLDLEQEALKFEEEHRWREFKMTHEKKYYTLEEEKKRKKIFSRNLAMIKEHNKRFYQGLETFSMGVNQFTDLTSQEFKDTYLNLQPLDATGYEVLDESWEESNEDEETSLTKNVSWYTRKIPIKNQGHCLSCWAFSATGVLEYAYYLFGNRKVVSLSEQELVDCDRKSHGCKRGVPYYSLKWVQKHGINFERDYPYKRRQGTCKPKEHNVKPNIIKSVGKTRGSEKEMLRKLKSNGPVQVAVNGQSWQHYHRGYLTPKNCTGGHSDHAVVAIAAVKYMKHDVWVLRNSWGAHWGIKGHAKILMFHNTCNIAQDGATYINH